MQQFVLLQTHVQHPPDDDDVPVRLLSVHSMLQSVHFVTDSLHVVLGQV